MVSEKLNIKLNLQTPPILYKQILQTHTGDQCEGSLHFAASGLRSEGSIDLPLGFLGPLGLLEIQSRLPK